MIGKKTKKRVSVLVLVFAILLQTFFPVVALALEASEDTINITSVERVGDNIEIKGEVSKNPEAKLILELGIASQDVPISEDGNFEIIKAVEKFGILEKVVLKFGTSNLDLTTQIAQLLADNDEDEIIEEPIIEEPVTEDPIDDKPKEDNPIVEDLIVDEPIVEEIDEDLIEEKEEEVTEEEEVIVEEEIEEEDDFVPSNPDGLEAFDDTPIPYIPESHQDFGGSRSSMRLMGNGSLAPGEIDTETIITPTSGMINTWDVTLRVYGKDSSKTNDIVLVIDTSGSMNSSGRMAAAKSAANQFIDTLLGPDGAPGTKIAVVSFEGAVYTRQGLTNNITALKSAVNALSANGGTYTQAGVRRAREILSGSNADYKNIVLLSDGEPTYSMEINNPDNYLIPWAWGSETSTAVPEGAYLNQRIGSGSDLRYRYSGNKYYNHGNSAIAEAGFAKSNATMYTVALSAGTIGTPILNQMASPGHAYDSDPASLGQAFQSIASSILSAVRDGSAPTCLASGFEVDAEDASNISALGSSYTLTPDGKTLTGLFQV